MNIPGEVKEYRRCMTVSLAKVSEPLTNNIPESHRELSLTLFPLNFNIEISNLNKSSTNSFPASTIRFRRSEKDANCGNQSSFTKYGSKLRSQMGEFSKIKVNTAGA